MDRHVRIPCPVHAQHPHGEGVVLGEGAESVEGRRHRTADFSCQRRQLGRGVGEYRPPSDVEDRAACRVDHVRRLFDLADIPFDDGVVVLQCHALRVLEVRLLCHHVLREVDKDRAGPAAGGDVKSLFDGLRELADVPDEIVMFGDGTRDPHDVRLLKRVVTDEPEGDLAGKDHERDRIHHRVRDPGHGVCRPGAGGDEDDAGLPGGLGVSLGRVRGPLLVPGQDVFDIRNVVQCVVHTDRRSSGIAEEDFDIFGNEAADEYLRPGHEPPSGWCRTFLLVRLS